MAPKIKTAARIEALDPTASEDDNRERIGGNNPPEPIDGPIVRVHIPTPEEIKEDLKKSTAKMLRRITALGKQCVKLTVEIETEAQQKTAQDAYKDLDSALKEWNGLRIKEKEDYLAGSRAVDSHFQAVRERGAEVLSELNGRLAGYLQRKEAAARAKREAAARQAREEEARKRQEAARLAEQERQQREALAAAERENREKEAAALRKKVEATQAKREFTEAVAEGANVQTRVAEARAAAPAPTLARTRGDSSLGTLARGYDFVIEDAAAIPLEELRPFFSIDDIEKAVRAMVRVHGDKRALPGVRIFEDTKASIR